MKRKPLTNDQIKARAADAAAGCASAMHTLAYPAATIAAIIESAMIEARDGIAK